MYLLPRADSVVSHVHLSSEINLIQMSVSLLLQTKGRFVDVSRKLGRSHSPKKEILHLFTQSHWERMIDGPRFALYHMCNTKSLYSVLLCLNM